jgi:MFS family permease
MTQSGVAHTHRVELQDAAALAAVGALLGVAFGLSTLITPLYLIYQQQFGFSQITLTLIYAAYAIGNVAALLFFGRISDRVGRRIIALSAIATLTVAAFVFLFANGIAALCIGRILCGLGIGIASGTGNAWLAELVGKQDKTRAAIIGTSTNFLGLGLAALLTAVVAVSAGLGYRGSLQVVNQIAPADRRAAVVSSYFICCFIGNALPVIGVGVLSSLTNTTVADVAFSCMIAAFAVVALIFGLVYEH